MSYLHPCCVVVSRALLTTPMPMDPQKLVGSRGRQAQQRAMQRAGRQQEEQRRSHGGERRPWARLRDELRVDPSHLLCHTWAMPRQNASMLVWPSCMTFRRVVHSGHVICWSAAPTSDDSTDSSSGITIWSSSARWQ